MTGSRMLAEMQEQPVAWLAWLSASTRTWPRFAPCRDSRSWEWSSWRAVLDNAAVYGRYLAELASGRPAGLAAPSLHTLYDTRAHYAGFLVVAISQSGATPEIVTVCRRLRTPVPGPWRS